jgi:PAS domain S-box-containing protein
VKTWMGGGSADRHSDAQTIAVSAGLFALVTVLFTIGRTPADGVGFLYVIPIGLVAIELGWRWGLGVAAACFMAYVVWAAIRDVELSLVGYTTRAVVLFSVGGVLGWVAARARTEGDESERWFSMANVMLATSSLDGRFTRLNQAWEKTLGWSREELMSKPYVRVHTSRRRQADVRDGGRPARRPRRRRRLREPLCDQGRPLALAALELLLRRPPGLLGGAGHHRA